MEATLIDRSNLQYFERLLYPQEVETLRAGRPLVALGAVEDGMACGALTGGPEGDRFVIDSIYVAPSCRGRGAGRVLMDELVRLCAFAPELEELRCSFTVLCTDHELLRGFLEKQDFRFEELPDGIVSVPLSALGKLPFYTTSKAAYQAYSLSELSESQLRELDRRQKADAGPVFRQPLGQAPIERDLSTATLAGGSIDGCLLFEKDSGGRLTLRYADAGASQNGGVFTSLLLKSYRIAAKKYAPDTEVLIQPVTELSQALVKRLAPSARNLSCSAVRWL